MPDTCCRFRRRNRSPDWRVGRRPGHACKVRPQTIIRLRALPHRLSCRSAPYSLDHSFQPAFHAVVLQETARLRFGSLPGPGRANLRQSVGPLPIDYPLPATEAAASSQAPPAGSPHTRQVALTARQAIAPDTMGNFLGRLIFLSWHRSRLFREIAKSHGKRPASTRIQARQSVPM